MEQNEFEGEFILDQEQTDANSDLGEDKNQRRVVKSSQAPDFVPWEETPLGTPKKVAVTRNVIIKKGSVTQGVPSPSYRTSLQ